MKKLVLSLILLFSGSIGAAECTSANETSEEGIPSFVKSFLPEYLGKSVAVVVPKKVTWEELHSILAKALKEEKHVDVPFRLVLMGRKVEPENDISPEELREIQNSGLNIIVPKN
jgi:hypothetical protein